MVRRYRRKSLDRPEPAPKIHAPLRNWISSGGSVMSRLPIRRGASGGRGVRRRLRRGAVVTELSCAPTVEHASTISDIEMRTSVWADASGEPVLSVTEAPHLRHVRGGLAVVIDLWASRLHDHDERDRRDQRREEEALDERREPLASPHRPQAGAEPGRANRQRNSPCRGAAHPTPSA